MPARRAEYIGTPGFSDGVSMNIDLTKRPTTYYVVVDDYRHVHFGQSQRDILYVERRADGELEEYLQNRALDDGIETCMSAELFTITAVSAAHAVGLARRDFHDHQTTLDLEGTFHAPERAFPGIADFHDSVEHGPSDHHH